MRPAAARATPIHLALTVTDPDGRPVTKLTQQNFTLLEDSRPQAILSLSKDDVPASIGILFDVSASVEKSLPWERAAALQFLKDSNPQDEFFLIGIAAQPQLLAGFTSAANIESHLSQLQAGHRTAFLDSVWLGLETMKDAKYPRKVFLIISDGGDNASEHSEKAIRSTLRDTDIQIDAVLVDSPDAATVEERNGPILLRDLTDNSGGRALLLDGSAHAADIGASLAFGLRTEYDLTCASDNNGAPGKWRKVKVKLQPPPGLPQLTVHARTGYYAPLQ
ncbi:MAG: VWA domain-containing protein [Acidobacteriaceae bacterium]